VRRAGGEKERNKNYIKRCGDNIEKGGGKKK
jgi:hypothetical protein